MDTLTAPVAPSRPARRATAAALVVAAAVGLALGGIDLHAQLTLPYPWADLANSAAVWALGAFLLGMWVGAPVRAAAAGVLALAVAVESYYLTAMVALHDATANLTSASTQAWLAFALLAGTLFGAAGAWARDPHPWLAPFGTALATSVLYAEAIVRLGSRSYGLQTALLEAVTGMLVLLSCARTHRQRAVAAVLCIPVTALGYAAFSLVGVGA